MTALLILVGCGRKRAGLEPGLPPDLAVAAYLPEGETETRTSVDVVFDRPVVSLGAPDPLPADGGKILVLDPRPPGYYHWVGTRTLSYIVPQGLPPATRFRARVPRGLRAADRTKLKRDVAWEFSTERPRLLASLPEPQDSLVRPEDPIVLFFNMEMPPEAVADAARLDGLGDWSVGPVDSALVADLGWPWSEYPLEHGVMLRPRRPPALNQTHTLTLRSGLQGKAGNLPLIESVRIPFRTYPPPGVKDIDPIGTGYGVEVLLHTPVDPDSLRGYLALEPKPADFQIWGEISSPRLTLVGLEPATSYAMRVAAGLPDVFGQRTAEAQRLTFRTADRSPSLAIEPQTGWGSTAVLPLPALRHVNLRWAGVTEVRLGLRLLSPEEEIRLHGTPMDSLFQALLPTQIYQGPAANKVVTRSVPIDQLVPLGKPGAVVVMATAETPEGRFLRRMAILRWTDLGVTVKGSGENGLVWVTRLTTGTPVGGAEIVVRDDEGAVRWRGQANAQGLAVLPGLVALGPAPRVAWAVLGDDAASGRLEGSWRLEPWTMDVESAEPEPEGDHTAFLHTDRDIYRPGDTLHVSGLLRRLTLRGIGRAARDSVTVSVMDPLWDTVLDTVLALDRFGGFALDIPTLPSAALGEYSIQAQGPGKEGTYVFGQTEVQVLAYRAGTFQVGVTPETDRVIAGDTLAARVEAHYFFGSPLAGARVQWSLTRGGEPWQPEDFQDFSFHDAGGRGASDQAYNEEYGEEYDEDLDESSRAVLAGGEARLDGSGFVRLTSVAPAGQRVAASRLNLEVGIEDPSGDTVHGRAAVSCFAASLLPGVAVPSRLTASGEEAGVKIVVLRADTERPAKGTAVRVTLERREWRTVRKLLVGGRVGYESTPVRQVVDERVMFSGSAPSDLSWKPAEPGAYVVTAEVTDSRGRTARASGSFYVGGGSGPLGPWEDDPVLTVTTDRKLYHPGETARLLVSTPVRAPRALLTLERDGILKSRIVDVTGVSPVFEVPVEIADAPNVFAGITLIEPEIEASAAPDLPEKARLARVRAGYAEIRVDCRSRRLDVEVTPDRAEYRPGQEATVELRVRNAEGDPVPARVSVAVVDEAVLSLLGGPDPDPFSFFYASRGLRVRTDDTRLELRLGASTPAEGEKEDAGGGGGETQVRSDFTSLAFWKADLFTDAQGRARATFKLPDNLTRYRVVAVAASETDRFGTGRGHVQVTQPLTLDPALPRFAHRGDAFEAAVLVTNRTGTPARAVVSLETDLAVVSPSRESSLRLGAGETARVAFPVRADSAGAARVRFKATLNGFADATEHVLVVVEPSLPQAAAAAGRTTGKESELLVWPRAALPGSARIDVTMSPSLLAGAERAFLEVVDYPYGCLEQVSSRLLALALYRRLTPHVSASWLDTLQVEEKIAEGIRQMELLASPGGTFSFWPGEYREAPPEVVAWAAYALAQCRRAGISVPQDLLDRAAAAADAGVRSLVPPDSSAAPRPRRESHDRENHPLGLWLLAALELQDIASRPVLEGIEIEAFADRRLALDSENQILLALALHKAGKRPEVVEKVWQEVSNHLEVSARGAVAPADPRSPVFASLRTSVRATALALLLGAALRPEHPLTDRLALGLLSLCRNGHWVTTQDDALALLALVQYQSRAEGAPASFTARVTLSGERDPLLRHAFAAGTLDLAQVKRALPASWPIGEPLRLDFLRDGRGDAFYSAVLRWDESGLDRPMEEQGFTLVRRIEPFEGEKPPGLGDVVLVVLEIALPRDVEYLALRDPLPAGLEAVHTWFKVESEARARRLSARPWRYRPLPTSHEEIRDREVTAFADWVKAGVYEMRYLARVRAVGTFGHPPATVEAMYAPELRAASASPPFIAGPRRP